MRRPRPCARSAPSSLSSSWLSCPGWRGSGCSGRLAMSTSNEPPRVYFVRLAQNLPGSRIHKMDSTARRTGHGFIGFAFGRDVSGDESLNAIARNRTAVEKWWHHPLPVSRTAETGVCALRRIRPGPPFLTVAPAREGVSPYTASTLIATLSEIKRIASRPTSREATGRSLARLGGRHLGTRFRSVGIILKTDERKIVLELGTYGNSPTTEGTP
jgi:hypothetical protein